MAAQTERVAPRTVRSKIRPIEFLTENGYSILRLAETEGTSAIDNRRHEFLVSSPDGFTQNVLVEIQSDLVTQIQIHTLGRILLASSFWICCAERHLADYIWECGKLPNGKLIVDQLTAEDSNLSVRWETT
jgi:hypothetical protein